VQLVLKVFSNFKLAKMKVRHSMCTPHKNGDIIFGPVRHFDWT